MKTKALITCPCDDILIDNLREAQTDVRYSPDISQQELLEVVGDFEILVISTSIVINKVLIENANKLKIVGRLGSGLDHIDTEALAAAGIKLFSTPSANARSVAEHVAGMLLSYTKNITRAEIEVKEGKWYREANRGTEIENKNIGIIGYGHNGSTTAKLLLAMGMNVKVYDPYIQASDNRIQFCETLDELMLDIDFLSFHVQLNSETHHYLDKTLITKASRPFVVINISRGEVVDSQALLDALEAGDVRAALLDVIENEKAQVRDFKWTPKSSVQRSLQNNPDVWITPHIAGYSQEAKFKMSHQLSLMLVHEIEYF